MKTVAVYRILYGEDFIEWSIRSLLDDVDEVWVFWTNDVWGKPKGVTYKGKWIEFPRPMDGAVERVKNIRSDKIRLVEAYHPTPGGQYAAFCQKYIDADVTIIVEWDHVFMGDSFKKNLDSFVKGGQQCAGTRQVELWKSPNWRFPYEGREHRTGPMFWRRGHYGGGANGGPFSAVLPHAVHNYGLAASPRTLLWKHLTGLAFADIVGDVKPSEDWYETVWLPWTPETVGLECSQEHRMTVPKAERVE